MPISSNIVMLRVISNTNGTFEFAVELDGTIGETRGLLEAQLLNENDQRSVKMTFRGVVMEKDDALWSVYSPRQGESMFAVVVAARSVAPTSLPGGNGMLGGGLSESDMGQQARMMEPMIDSMVNNPGFVDMLIGMSPDLKDMVDKNPEMRQQLQNPDMMRLMMRSQYDPVAKREMDRAMNSQMAQLNNIPGGMAMLERMMGNMLREERYAPKTAADRKMASEENSRPKQGQTSNNLEAPNPWARPQPVAHPLMGMGAGGMGLSPFAGIGGGFDGSRANLSGGFGGGNPMMMMNPFSMFAVPPPNGPVTGSQPVVGRVGVSQPVVAVADYREQMSVLRDMGFEDESLMLRALQASSGDIDGAVAFIDREQGGV